MWAIRDQNVMDMREKVKNGDIRCISQLRHMESNLILKKQLAIKYAGGMQQYEYFKRVMGASPALYPHQFLFYNDDVSARHARNIKEVKLLQTLLKQGKIDHQMLHFNTLNTFYPSYILAHHIDIFLPILRRFANESIVKELLVGAQNCGVTGAFFQEKLRLDFKDARKELPVVKQGVIHMEVGTFFYSGVTSPYISHCAFLAHQAGGLALVIVQVRTVQGQLAAGVKGRDMGATVSDDYLSIGYNFNGVKPLVVLQVPAPIGKKIWSISSKQRFHEFTYSLRDLQKSLWVTIKYTKMRRQFKTLDQSREQRRILSYQAVSTRIANGFSHFLALTDLYSRLNEHPRAYLLAADMLESAHSTILEQLVQLRECCGGFGYMQVSGHPGCIERTSYRAGSEPTGKLKLTPQYLQATQYYASSEESQQYYCQPFSLEKPSYMNLFGVFLSIVFGMRRNQGELSDLQYRRQYLKQASLLAMHLRQEFTRHDASNIHCQMLQYAFASYILAHPSFINWQLIQSDPPLFFKRLEEFRNAHLSNISAQLEDLGDTLELTYLRNTIVGREDAEEFYQQVLATSKANLRNNQEYLAYVQKPIVDMVTSARAKL